MLLPRRSILAGGAAMTLTACSSKFRKYNGPEVTRLQVVKERRKLYLFHNRELLADYKIHLGNAA